MYDRFKQVHIEEALADTPAVLVVGPRRAGKTTLVRAAGGGVRTYVNLDEEGAHNAARADPYGFIRNMDVVTIDEVQRVPELILAIKRSIDEGLRPGRFLLTGSANVMTLPKVADSLAGRMETIQVLPLSQSEMRAGTHTFLDALFEEQVPASPTPIVGSELVELVLRGGYPEMLERRSERRRQEWADAYLESVLMRDLREIAVVERLAEFPRFVQLLAHHSGQLISHSSFGSEAGFSYKTSQRYLGLLETIFLVAVLPPWYTNRVQRVVKTPKLHFLDSGLLSAAAGFSASLLESDRSAFGALLETFVVSEVMKLVGASRFRLAAYHFRDARMREVDLVIERNDQAIVGIEIKASATITSKDFEGLRILAEASGKRFRLGVVLYDGKTSIPFGDRLWALPLSCLWS